MILHDIGIIGNMYEDVEEEETYEVDCASMHETYHFPVAYPTEAYYHVSYHCLLYTVGDEYDEHAVDYVICSADVVGIFEHSEYKERVIEHFRAAIQTRIAEGQGGLYLGTSDFSFQHDRFRELEEDWVNDGVIIVEKQEIIVNIFTHQDTYVRLICE